MLGRKKEGGGWAVGMEEEEGARGNIRGNAGRFKQLVKQLVNQLVQRNGAKRQGGMDEKRKGGK